MDVLKSFLGLQAFRCPATAELGRYMPGRLLQRLVRRHSPTQRLSTEGLPDDNIHYLHVHSAWWLTPEVWSG